MKNPRLFVAILCISFLNFFSGVSIGQIVLEDSILQGKNFEKAAFRLRLNESGERVRGVLVLVPGSNTDGRNMAADTAWQHLADRHHLAVLACYFKDSPHQNMAAEEYADAKNGSGQALLDVLKRFSQASHHPELEGSPVVLWGMSAGGQFNFEFTCWKPERVIAFIVNKGGIYYSSLAPAAAWEVPGVFFTGDLDSPFRNNIVKGIFSINRRFGAKWILAEEPRTAHEFKNSAQFARLFFDEVVPLRLAASGQKPSGTLAKLNPVGFIGIIGSKMIQPYNGIPALTELTSWFPDKRIAEAWIELTK
jgi:dienelactone hydrolase